MQELFTHTLLEKVDNYIKLQISPTTLCKNEHGVLHGGIQALIIDDYAFALMMDLKEKHRFLTTNLSVNYHKISRIKPIICEVSLISISDNVGAISVKLSSMSNQLISTGRVEFAILNY